MSSRTATASSTAVGATRLTGPVSSTGTGRRDRRRSSSRQAFTVTRYAQVANRLRWSNPGSPRTMARSAS